MNATTKETQPSKEAMLAAFNVLFEFPDGPGKYIDRTTQSQAAQLIDAAFAEHRERVAELIEASHQFLQFPHSPMARVRLEQAVISVKRTSLKEPPHDPIA